MKVVITVFIIAFISCGPSKTITSEKLYRKQIIGNDTLNILREAYIIDRSGAKIYLQEGQEESACIAFGEPVNVFIEKDSIIGVAPFDERDNLYLILKKATGTELDIPLNNNDLNQEFNSAEHDYNRAKIKYDCDYSEEEPFDPNAYLDVEVNLITDKEFEKMKSNATQHLIANNAVKKTGGIITIGNVKFEDSLGEGYLPNTYNYVGEYRFPEGYLLRYTCEACEEYTYYLIDKTTGKEIAAFNDIPYFSRDGTLVLTLGQLFSDQPTLLYINKWKDQESQYIHKEFGRWVPVGEGFWGADNCFYTAVIPFMTSESYNTDYNQKLKAKYNFRYIKIKIKGPTPIKEIYQE